MHVCPYKPLPFPMASVSPRIFCFFLPSWPISRSPWVWPIFISKWPSWLSSMTHAGVQGACTSVLWSAKALLTPKLVTFLSFCHWTSRSSRRFPPVHLIMSYASVSFFPWNLENTYQVLLKPLSLGCEMRPLPLPRRHAFALNSPKGFSS